MKTYIITKREIKQRDADKVRRLARYLSERNNEKYTVYACVQISEIKNKEERIFYDGRKPDKITMQQEIAFQIREGKKRNPIDDIFGTWPGKETDAEFEEMLKDLD